jgi:hypothetical protein
MLERPRLLSHPWAPAGADTWARRVVVPDAPAGPDAGGYLGQVRCAGASRRSWLAWLRPHRFEVLETEDGALLLTLVRSWGLVRAWEVYDADDHRVGTLAPPVLLDGDGLRRGHAESDDPARGRLVGPTGRLLADYALTEADALSFGFAADLEPDPFLRMLLLSAALTLQPPPLGA